MPNPQLSAEEQLIRRYFDAFNRHDLEGVVACFHDQAVVIDGEGRRIQGKEAIRRRYQSSISRYPDGQCELCTLLSHGGKGVAESVFRGTRAQDGVAVEGRGAELLEIEAGKIKELRDYHRSPRHG